MSEELLIELRNAFKNLAAEKDTNGKYPIKAPMVRLFFSNGKELNAIIDGVTDAGWVRIWPIDPNSYEPYVISLNCNYNWRLDSISGFSVLRDVLVTHA